MHYPVSFGGELHYPVGFLWKTEADMLGEQKPKEPCVPNLLPLAVNAACVHPTWASLMLLAAPLPMVQDARELRGLGCGDG